MVCERLGPDAQGASEVERCGWRKLNDGRGVGNV